MLSLNNITKEYTAGDDKVEALRGVSIEFRDNEFVSILGQSGCGKTTLLNIIGGLDQYTTGDLIISGKSTREFKDRDWDTYRNHKVGFVFQSYNLIMHQSVLQNVELALTLSGVSKAERKERAKEALKRVGLADQINKRPNQMSGGQMQRVAIARALVNDPEILLADEPTGALDSTTSIQIMDLLKEIAQDRLVIMVTHNPELAEQYSTRIIRLLDGKVIDDTNPYSKVDELADKAQFAVTDAKNIPLEDIPYKEPKKKTSKNKKKTSMSFFTALSLSLNNLMTKKARTALTSFAGSIGIIGIALILSISSGLQMYVNKVQEDTLSSYPISILKEDVNLSSLISSIQDTTDKEINHDMDKIYTNLVLYEMIESLANAEVVENNLKDFKTYLDKNMQHDAITSVVYTYDMDLNIYASGSEVRKLNPSSLMKNLQNMTGAGIGGMSMGMDIWGEMMRGKNGEYVNELVTEQYDILDGRWPQAYNEVVLVADKNNEINDIVLCMLGFKSEEELSEIIKAAMKGEEITVGQESWTYEEILNTTFKLVIPTDYYKLNDGKWTNMSDNDAYMKVLLQNAEDIRIVGIVKPNEDAVSTSISSAIGYTYALTEYVSEKVAASDIVKQQIANPDVDVISGLPFKTDDFKEPSVNEKAKAFKEYVQTLDVGKKAELALKVLATMSQTEIDQQVNAIMVTFPNRQALEDMIVTIYSEQTGMDAAFIREQLAKMTDDELENNVRLALSEQIKTTYEETIKEQMASLTPAELGAMLDQKLMMSADNVVSEYYDKYMPAVYSNSTYDNILSKLGVIDLDNPSSINIYASSFKAKDQVEELINEYNASVSEDDRIQYTDYIKLILSSVTKIINAVSYILIAFVSISLIVSSIMIGIITYISVLERTKEIGVLRSIGASKKDISSVFNAETLIVGFASGMFGIITTLILNIPINIIVYNLTEIKNIAVLPYQGAIALVLISMGLTLIAGLLPSRIAAKKDPVEALRTE